MISKKFLKEECEKIGVSAELESFEVDGCNIKKALLKFLDPEIEVRPSAGQVDNLYDEIKKWQSIL